MNQWIQLKTIPPFLITFALLCFGLLPRAQAVVPPPDGAYPNFTTAEGQKALFSLTSGAGNTAIGWFSLKSVTTGGFNTGVGAGTLALNTGDENTAVGTAALLLNTASGNTAVGSRALLNNTTGGTLGNIQGLDFGPNVAVGSQALESNTLASGNTAVGYQALESFTAGPVGGTEPIGLCTAVGFQALASTSGEGNANSAVGYQALMNNVEGPNNTAIGFRALTGNTIGGGNAAVGSYSLEDHTEGDFNTAIGFRALGQSMTGSENTAVGAGAGSSVSTASNVICIGAVGADVSNSCFIGNIWTQPGGTQAVYVNSDGKLGALVSSRRFKDEIKPMEQSSELIYSLKPVSFRYKAEIEPNHTASFGLIAEDVAAVNPDLVVHDKEGKPYSVRYDQVNAMLLNEFLKEHRTVQELKSNAAKQEATIAQQQKQIEALAAGLQKVSAELELRGAPTQTALNNQ
jgi:hypothetical protein